MADKPLLKFKGDCLELQQNDCECNSWSPTGGSLFSGAKQTTSLRRRLQIGWLGLFLFLIALVSSLYLVWRWREFQEINRTHQSFAYDKELKLVSMFSRHGDRAPSDELPDIDKHKEAIEFFWPNGLHNLTDLGKSRSYKLGLALRHMYDGYVGYDHHDVLAFSSKKLRCLESQQSTLKGFYEIEGPRSRGQSIVSQWRSNNCTECLPNGPGSPEVWKLITPDTESLRTLTESEVDSCRYRKENPSPLVENLKIHPKVKALPGIERLEQLMVERYGLSGLQGGVMTSLYSTITSELNLARTQESIKFTDHFSDWLNEVVGSTPDGQYNITLYDILEQASVFKYRDQTLGVAKWLEIGPLLTSLVDSQLISLGQQPTELGEAKEKLYRGKRVVFYSSHDTILQRILQHLELMDFEDESTYEQRIANWKQRGADELDKFMSGLSLAAYGMSIKFELWEAKPSPPAMGSTTTNGNSGFPYVQVALYNQEESRFGDIVFKPLRLGDACVRLFKRQQQQQGSAESLELDRFFSHDFPIDWRFGCPFELFRNVTADIMVEVEKFKELC